MTGTRSMVTTLIMTPTLAPAPPHLLPERLAVVALKMETVTTAKQNSAHCPTPSSACYPSSARLPDSSLQDLS